MDMERVWEREARDVIREAQAWRAAEVARLPRDAGDYAESVGDIDRRAIARVNDRIAALLSSADLTFARYVAREWHRAHDTPATERLNDGEGIDRIAQRLSAAWCTSGYAPDPEDLLLAYPYLSDADLSRAGRMRAVGAWAEWGLMQPAGAASIGQLRGGLAGWARRMHWLLVDMDLLRLATPRGIAVREYRTATVLTHPEVMPDLARAVCAADMSHAWTLYDDRYLGLAIMGQVQGEWATAHATVDLGLGGQRRAQAYLRDIPGIRLPGAIREDVAMHDMRGGGGSLLPVQSPIALDDFLATCATCAHPRAVFAPNPTEDALRLACPDCGQLSLACVPLHQAPGHALPERYLMHERFYASLDGTWSPDRLEDLAGPLMSLDPADHLPQCAPPGGAADLTSVLFA